MIVTAVINGVTIEASGTPEELNTFIRALIQPVPPEFYGKGINEILGECPTPVCSRCNDTEIQHSYDGVNWIAGVNVFARFNRYCPGYGERNLT